MTNASPQKFTHPLPWFQTNSQVFLSYSHPLRSSWNWGVPAAGLNCQFCWTWCWGECSRLLFDWRYAHLMVWSLPLEEVYCSAYSPSKHSSSFSENSFATCFSCSAASIYLGTVYSQETCQAAVLRDLTFEFGALSVLVGRLHRCYCSFFVWTCYECVHQSDASDDGNPLLYSSLCRHVVWIGSDSHWRSGLAYLDRVVRWA